MLQASLSFAVAEVREEVELEPNSHSVSNLISGELSTGCETKKNVLGQFVTMDMWWTKQVCPHPCLPFPLSSLPCKPLLVLFVGGGL